MATGRERRAERLNERLRGAQRTNVGDDSFSLDIAGLDEPAAAPDTAGPTPNTSAKRRRIDADAASAASQGRATAAGRRPSRPPTKSPYDMPNTSKESLAQKAPRRQDPRRSETNRASVARSSVSQRSPLNADDNDDDDDDDDLDALETLPAPSSARSPARARVARSVLEEIEESPAAAPGSGRRRSVLVGSAVGSSARLQDVLESEDVNPVSSSPLARKKRRSDAAASVRSARTDRTTTAVADEVDELSPDRSREPDEESLVDVEEQAEEIDEAQAAKALGRKRPRRSLPAESPELGSDHQEEEEELPVPKRRRGQVLKSPAAQKQPAAKPKKQQPAKAKKTAAATARRESSPAADENVPIDVTVQRFVNYKQRGDGDDDEDPLHAELPFAFRNVETAVDVFAQVCEEVIGQTLAQLQQKLYEADDAATKKACRIKMRAIEAYREELSSRMLQHAIHLNHWQSLRKRVRHVQKEKLVLRDEILRLKAEREQVALRMDAVRIKHEADTKEATYRLDASALMHDIDLAVEQGRDAPELSRAAQKQAELANLELLVSRISDQASSTSSTGGLLDQVKDFNAFLERAAIALEAR